jgi:hypothetical protein
MLLPKNCCSTLLITDIKDSLKEDARLFALGFCFRLLLLGFKLFDVGGFGREKNC